MGKPAPQLKPYHWKPGISGNPGGRPKGQLTVEQVQSIFQEIAKLPISEIEKISIDKNESGIRASVAMTFMQALKSGDAARLSFLLDRAVGKVKDVVEAHNHDHKEALDTVPKKTLGEYLKYVQGGTDAEQDPPRATPGNTKDS